MPTRPRGLRRFAFTLLALLAGLGAPARAQVTLPPFEAAASRMQPTGKLGTILLQQRIATDIPGAQAWKIAYVSSDLRDRPTLATGLVIAPLGPAPKGGRPVLSWAHGTTGTAANCGPSQVPGPATDLNEYFLIGGDSWTDYGVPAASALIKEGYVLVATDYQGLGGGGRHQYALAATQARDVINAIRAAGVLKEAGAGRRALVYGWSQGGGATLAAASAGDYIARKGTAFDGIELLGFVAMAPQDTRTVAPPGPLDEASATAMLAGLGKAFSDNIFNFTHFAMALWGAQAADPDRLRLTDIFTTDGARAIDRVLANKCMHPAADTLRFAYGEGFASLVLPQPANALAWAEALVAGAGTEAPPVAPVIIYYGDRDTTVPPVMGKLYRERMCGRGANVARVQLPGEQSHFTTPGAAQPLYLPWIAERFAGKPAPNGCEGG
jgi:Secretory lipase